MRRLCTLHDVPRDGSRGFVLAEHSLFAVRRGDEVHVYLNRCPHLGIELNWQEDVFLEPDGSLIQCATHGALFLIETGECVAGPCAGASLRRIPARLRDGAVYVELPAAPGSPG